MGDQCELCGRWPRVPSEFDADYCGYCTWMMLRWSEGYGREYELSVVRGLSDNHWRVRLNGWWSSLTFRTVVPLVETYYAIKHGGPFDFAPWSTIRRAICRWTYHNWPVRVAMSTDLDEDGRRWWLYRCTRCSGEASLPDDECSSKRFAAKVSYNTIWCGYASIPTDPEAK